jgi:hypothetical protein
VINAVYPTFLFLSSSVVFVKRAYNEAARQAQWGVVAAAVARFRMSPTCVSNPVRNNTVRLFPHSHLTPDL